MVRIARILLIAAVILTTAIAALYVGLTESGKEETFREETYQYAESESGTYWVEIYDDGRAVIHTQLRFVTTDKDDNLIVKGYYIEEVE